MKSLNIRHDKAETSAKKKEKKKNSFTSRNVSSDFLYYAFTSIAITSMRLLPIFRETPKIQ